MRTYVQCSYCLGYNTRRIPIVKNLDGRILVTPPEHIVRFASTNCTPKEWTPIVDEQYNFMGFCEHCQSRFIIEKKGILRMMNGEPSELRQKPFLMKIEDVFSLNIRTNLSVVVGRIESGFILMGDRVWHRNVRKVIPYAEFEDNVGILLNVEKEKINIGDILTKQVYINKGKDYEFCHYSIEK